MRLTNELRPLPISARLLRYRVGAFRGAFLGLAVFALCLARVEAGTVKLAWGTVTNYTDGSACTVAQYRIWWRSASNAAPNLLTNVLAEVPLEPSQTSVVTVADTRWWFDLSAVDNLGGESDLTTNSVYADKRVLVQPRLRIEP